MAQNVVTTAGGNVVTTAGGNVITTAPDAPVAMNLEAGRLKLIIGGPSSDIFTLSNQRVALVAEHSLAGLKWKFNLAEGGLGSGEALVQMDRSSAVYDLLVRRGQAGVARIVWIRDEVTAGNYDVETDLLWIGLVEDAEVERYSNIVKFRLRGAGSVLEDLTFTGSFNGEKITDVAHQVLAATIRSGSFISFRDVDAGGVLQRRVTKTYDRTSVAKILTELAEAAGGPSMVAWGVRPPDNGATQQAIAYFKVFGAHLYSKDSGAADPPRAFAIGGSMALSKTLQFTTSDIRNVVTVIGDRLEGRPGEAIRYVSASALSQDSIGRYGARYLTVQDSALKTEGQCSAVAAGKVIELASRRVETELEALVTMRNAPTKNGKARNLVNDTILRPGKVFTVRDEGENFVPWGDNRKVLSTVRNVGTPEFLRVDLTSAPSTDAPLVDLKTGLGSGVARIYVVQQARPAMVTPTTGVSVLELDRAIAVAWEESAPAVWKLATYYRNAAHAWTALGLSTATYTTAQLADVHLVALEVSRNSGTVHNVKTWVWRSAVAVLMTSDTLTASLVSSEATTSSLYVNATRTSAVDTPAAGGDSQAAETLWLAAFKTWPAGVTEIDQLQAIGSGRPPWKRYRDMVLLSDFPKYDAAGGLVLFRYSFNQVARRTAFDGVLVAGATVADASSAFFARNYDWQLGGGPYRRTLGTHVEIFPAGVEFQYGGPRGKLYLRVSGATGARTASAALQEIAVAIQEAQENARKSS